MIKGNAHRYSVSAQCKTLGVARATYYRNCDAAQKPDKDLELKKLIDEIFVSNRCVFGARKIKRKLYAKHGLTVSVRRINRNMRELGFMSVYGKKRYKAGKWKVNESAVPNILDRSFNDKKPYEVIVSDLTYARVKERWHYVCILLDLFNREIAGYSAGSRRDAALVHTAFAKIKTNLSDIHVFHTDRGSEFDNTLIDELLDTFGIARSLSIKACPYDNAVAEATFKLIKSEFINRQMFDSLDHLQFELDDYVRWYNQERPHSTLGYLTPLEYRNAWTDNRLNSKNDPRVNI